MSLDETKAEPKNWTEFLGRTSLCAGASVEFTYDYDNDQRYLKFRLVAPNPGPEDKPYLSLTSKRMVDSFGAHTLAGAKDILFIAFKNLQQEYLERWLMYDGVPFYPKEKNEDV